ncbi:MAG: YoaK family protein [Paracoccaceae bacterium]
MKTRRRILHPVQLARATVARRRSAGNDLLLATVLAAIAGAANAGGFFALGQYTSHMTGYLSQLADNIAVLNLWIVSVSALAILAFIAGAGLSTVLINLARETASRQQFAWPLAVQGVFLFCFAFGGIFSSDIGRLFALACLCFIMGMQNATITKISGARIRTTHATGMITDIGIEAGRAFLALLRPGLGVRVDRGKLRILLRLVLAFLVGGVIGAVGYGQLGFFFSMPLALILLAISVPALLGQGR